MANIVIMPKQGLQMTEGLITKWLKAVGDSVTEGEPLFEMETDKLTITIDSSFTGTLLKIVREEGEEVPITEPIAVIGEAGEDISGLDLGTPAPAAEEAPAVEEAPAPAPAPVAPAPAPVAAPVAAPALPKAPGERVFITPRARMRCIERGIADFTKIPGTGDDGLIIERDVLNYKIPVATGSSCSRLCVRANVGAAEKYSKSALESGVDFSVDTLVAKAAAAAAKKYEAFANVTVKSVCASEVEEYFAALGAGEDAVVSAGGIYTSGNDRLTVLSVGFNEDVLDASAVAEYLTYLKGLLENPLLMMAI